MFNIYICCYKNLKKYYSVLINNEEVFLKTSDVEALHQMRVAVRRMRSVINSFGGCIEEDSLALISIELKKFAKKLGRTRDLDVSMLYFSSFLKKYPDNEGVTFLLEGYQKKQNSSRQKLAGFLKSAEHKTLKRKIKKVLKNLKKHSLKADFKDLTCKYLNNLEVLIDKVYKFKEENNLEKDQELLHSLRIAIKHLRYNLEFLGLKTKKATKAIEIFKNLQDKLGLINDYNFMNDRLLKKINKNDLNEEIKSGIKLFMDNNELIRRQELNKIKFPWDQISLDALKAIYSSLR